MPRSQKRMPEKKNQMRGKGHPVITEGKNDRFQRTFTPLTKQHVELLEVVMKKQGVQFPIEHDHPSRKYQSYKFCKFHNEYEHLTNDCRNLKIAIEKLIQEGELLEYVRKESNQYKRRKDDKEGKSMEKTPQGETFGKAG